MKFFQRFGLRTVALLVMAAVPVGYASAQAVSAACECGGECPCGGSCHCNHG